jgi:ferric-dicitrate binding protein FerR (iron transport regulator)
VASTPERGPEGGGLRASDADRERAAAVLRQHCSAGRLTMDELAERLELAYHARTLDQLFALTNDLPDPEPHPHLPEHLSDLPTVVPRRRRALAADLAAFAVVNAVLVVVWAATGGGYFWPAWTLVGWAVVVVVHAVAVVRSIARGDDGD